ncbi:c-type cytochrome [Salipaludibacillus sp. HK11]|uniref:c-type cytochrome n=1 Tax=Salipaludibacillus sp. HK11 TaxID=3394320 RepID=UPI0039FC445D
MMRKILTLMLGAGILLGACGGNNATDNEAAPTDDTNNNVEETNNAGNEGTEGTYDLANGEDLYGGAGSCSSCHGGNLEGLSGPAITGYDYEEVLDAIHEGRTGMPADLVEGEDAEDVAAWVAEQ